MVTPDTVVVGVDPYDIPYAMFQRIQRDRKSPAAEWAHGGYEAIAANRVSIAFGLAVFNHESQMATDPNAIVVKYDTKNPGNCRSLRPDSGAHGTVIKTPRGEFVKYQDWTYGWQDFAYRLVDPHYVYVKEGRRTIRQIIERFAPAEDSNDPDSYVNAVVRDMNRWIGESPVPTQRRIALSAGHHNTSGGDAIEVQQTGPLTAAIAKACRARGMDVRVVQGRDGLDMFPGTLSDAARAVVVWSAAGWTPDIFMEVHTEGGGGIGAFAIFPDADGDLDTDVRDKLGPDAVRRISAATGLGVRTVGGKRGVMSEKETGVGAQGFRLGVFGATAPLKATTTRLIIEFGAHDRQPDIGIARQPGFNEKCAGAVADAFAAFLNVPMTPEPQPEPQTPPRPAWVTDATARYFPETQQWVQHAFKARHDELGALALLTLGYPISPEYRATIDDTERTVQEFERAMLAYYPEATPPWHVRVVKLDEALEAREAA